MKRGTDILWSIPKSTPGSGRWRKAEQSRAVSRSAFDGTVPVLTIAPPGRGLASTIAVRCL